MITLKELKWLQKLIGLNPRGGVENVIVRFMISASILLSILVFFIFFVLKINEDKYKAVAGLPAIFGHLLIIAYYSELLIRRESFNSILGDLQNIVNESIILLFCSCNDTESITFSSHTPHRREKGGKQENIRESRAANQFCNENYYLRIALCSNCVSVSVFARSVLLVHGKIHPGCVDLLLLNLVHNYLLSDRI